jgi:pimeloyl-ACP methyl ester carboxylesterase
MPWVPPPWAMVESFEISVPQPVLDDLAFRLGRARLPHEDAKGWDGGMNPSYLRELVAYWRERFDWRAQERLLNRFHHHRAVIGGIRLHFVHEKGRGPSPLPLILTHGFPDSFFRFYKLIPLLADPGSHGADPEDAFDVVVPSLPGYGFSERREGDGGIFGVGDLWYELMTAELGYSSFAAHGGDWGSTVTEHLGRSHSRSVVGIHLTDVPFWHIFEKPKDLSAAEQTYLERNARWQRKEGAYAMIQGTRPRTLGAGLRDSPVGLAAWLVEKFQRWSDCGEDLERRYTKDELLTNVMIYWATGTIESSFQPYRDVVSAGAMRWITEGVKKLLGSQATPAGFALFPKDISTPPREWAERFFNVERWTEMPRGGHFAALEEPQLLAEDIRAFFRPVRRRLC